MQEYQVLHAGVSGPKCRSIRSYMQQYQVLHICRSIKSYMQQYQVLHAAVSGPTCSSIMSYLQEYQVLLAEVLGPTYGRSVSNGITHVIYFS